MSDAQLNVLNYALLALIYVFFARVRWAVWGEVRGPRPGVQAAQTAGVARADSTATAGRPGPGGMPGAAPVVVVPPRAPRKRGIPQRLVVLQPKVRKGSAYPIGAELTRPPVHCADCADASAGRSNAISAARRHPRARTVALIAG